MKDLAERIDYSNADVVKKVAGKIQILELIGWLYSIYKITSLHSRRGYEKVWLKSFHLKRGVIVDERSPSFWNLLNQFFHFKYKNSKILNLFSWQYPFLHFECKHRNIIEANLNDFELWLLLNIVSNLKYLESLLFFPTAWIPHYFLYII